ncbi:hypothetical protein LI328DRAFT_135765 [Trichoderma asperelloides]|nr:hypothetical protein LI328DRAFT_135765 [Trichoderma asperelloides]
MVIPSWKGASKQAWAWNFFVWAVPCGRATYVRASCTRTSGLRLVVSLLCIMIIMFWYG